MNDGTDNLYALHAWYMFRNRMTDLTLCRPLRPEVQKAGPLIIHGRTVTPGWTRYTYHSARPAEGLAVIQQLLSNSSTRPMLIEQEDLHLSMVATVKSASLVRAYLDGAPDGLEYSAIAAAVQHAA